MKIIFCRWTFCQTAQFLMKVETGLAKEKPDAFTKANRSEVAAN